MFFYLHIRKRHLSCSGRHAIVTLLRHSFNFTSQITRSIQPGSQHCYSKSGLRSKHPQWTGALHRGPSQNRYGSRLASYLLGLGEIHPMFAIWNLMPQFEANTIYKAGLHPTEESIYFIYASNIKQTPYRLPRLEAMDTQRLYFSNRRVSPLGNDLASNVISFQNPSSFIISMTVTILAFLELPFILLNLL